MKRRLAIAAAAAAVVLGSVVVGAVTGNLTLIGVVLGVYCTAVIPLAYLSLYSMMQGGPPL